AEGGDGPDAPGGSAGRDADSGAARSAGGVTSGCRGAAGVAGAAASGAFGSGTLATRRSGSGRGVGAAGGRSAGRGAGFVTAVGADGAAGAAGRGMGTPPRPGGGESSPLGSSTMSGSPRLTS